MATSTQYNSNICGDLSVQIANTFSLSQAIDLDGTALVGLVMPAFWDAANITFQASVDGTTYNNLYKDDGTELTVTAAAARYIRLNPADFAGIRFLKVRSGTNGTPVNQTANRTIVLVTRPL